MIKACREADVMDDDNKALADQPVIKYIIDQLLNAVNITYGDISKLVKLC